MMLWQVVDLSFDPLAILDCLLRHPERPGIWETRDVCIAPAHTSGWNLQRAAALCSLGPRC